jgi:hypothetical protein
MAPGRVEPEDEGIAQRAANSPRLDLRALWRRTPAAPLFPIGIELAACRVFHENRLPAPGAAAAHLSPNEVTKTNNFSGLRCQTTLAAHIGRKRLFGGVSNRCAG